MFYSPTGRIPSQAKRQPSVLFAVSYQVPSGLGMSNEQHYPIKQQTEPNSIDAGKMRSPVSSAIKGKRREFPGRASVDTDGVLVGADGRWRVVNRVHVVRLAWVKVSLQ